MSTATGARNLNQTLTDAVATFVAKQPIPLERIRSVAPANAIDQALLSP